MLKKILIAGLALLLVGGLTVYLFARSVLASDAVRTTLAGQLTKVLGQPVQIGGIAATILPRVTVTLDDVRIGEPARIVIARLHVGTAFGALLSRKIEHAALSLSGARIELPLPAFALGQPTPGAGGPSGRPPVELVSIDEIALTDVEVVSGGRSLRGNIEIVPAAPGFSIRKMTLAAGDTSIDITGTIANPSGPVGDLTVKASGLDIPALLAFLADFSKDAGPPSSTRAPGAPSGASLPATAVAMNLSATIHADRAVFGSLTLSELSGRAQITPQTVTVEPARFHVFGGGYDGSLALTLGDAPAFTIGATIAGVDMAEFTRFAGQPDSMTGRLSGRIDLTGRASDVVKTTRGRARVDVTDGSVKGLGLVRSIVLATSGRSNATADVSGTTAPEPFSRLGATLDVADGAASTGDLRFESKDLLLSGRGGFRLDGSSVDLRSQVQLSEALSSQAGRDLVRYTQQGGRVTLPVTVNGALGALHVRVDVGDVAKRAITNRAGEEAGKAIKKGLGGLMGR